MRATFRIWAAVQAIALLFAVGAWAQSSTGGQGLSSGQPSPEEVRRAVEQAAGAARQAIESLPDPAQAATQFTEEALNQGKPIREVMFVYSLSPWTGKQFGGTFAPREAKTMFLMAGAHSIVNAQRTEVYYWPITSEYMANWFEMREEVPGRLQIEQDGRVVATLDRVDYGYYYPQGYGGPQELKLGQDAITTYDDYQRRMDGYYDSLTQYYEDQRQWQQTMDVILREVRETGKPKDPSEIPEPPKQPEPPQDFSYQPRKAFAVNLPPGTYTVKVIGEDGQVVPESERTLQVFGPRRTGVGYDVIPEHKWTRRFQSNDASDVFYLDGTRVFYILPYHAREFNLYEYTKMTNLHKPLEGEGTRSAWAWAQFEPIENATLQVLRDGEVVQEIRKQPFYVKQTAGYALGYEIVLFDPKADPTLEGRQPTFEAYRVVMRGDADYQLRFVDAEGNVLDGSVRAVRALKQPGGALYSVSLIPLVMGAVVYGWRRTKSRKKGPGEAAGDA